MKGKKKQTRPLRFRIEETVVSYRVVDVPIDVDCEVSYEYVDQLCNGGDIDITKDDGVEFTRRVDLCPFNEE